MDGFQVFLVVLIVVGLAIALGVAVLQNQPIEQTCADLNGYLCQPEECFGELSTASDGFCCSQKCSGSDISATCDELNGRECSLDQKCSDTLQATIDTDSCCTGTCEDIDKLKTCSQLNGYSCSDASECSGNFLFSSDSICCDKECTKPISFSQCQVLCPYDSLCDKPIKTDGAFKCCETSCNAQKTNTCNYNKICESFEDPSCLDCQCSGVVCDGVCHENVDPNFECSIFEAPYITINLDTATVPKDSWVDATMIIKSRIKTPIEISLDLTGQGVDVQADAKNIKLYDLGVVSIPVKIKGNIVSYYNISSVFGNTVKTLVPSFINFEGDIKIFGRRDTIKESKQILVYDSNATSCGKNKFGLEGMCVNGVYYLDRDCSTGADCLNGMSWWFFIDKFVKPKGKISVGLISLDRELTGDEISNTKEIADWYDREALKYAGKDMIDIEFSYIGRVNISSDIIKDATDEFAGTNFNTTSSYTELANKVDLSLYDIIVIITNKQVKSSRGHAVGLKFFENMIIQSTTHPTYMAHEIAHIFGCRDLYFGNLCESAFNNNLMCSTGTELKKIDLGVCAAEMGWADRDGDNILDIDDAVIEEKSPSWLTGIKIEVANQSIEIDQTNKEYVEAIVHVKDNRGGTISNAKVTRKVNTMAYPCLYPWVQDLKKAYFCSEYYSGPYPVDMEITAEYMGYTTVKTVTFRK